MSDWTTHDYERSWKIPHAPGVYAIYMDDQLVYIGQSSSSVRNRLLSCQFRYGYSNAIITPWGDTKELKVKVSGSRRYGDWAMRELRLIRRLRPTFNIACSGRKRASA